MIDHVAPTLVIEYIAPAPLPVTSSSPSQQFPPANTMEQLVAKETTQNTVEVPTDHKLVVGQMSFLEQHDNLIDYVSPLNDLGARMENPRAADQADGQADDDEHLP